MKKQLLTLALSALAFSSFAKIRIADNNGNNPQNYTSLQKAIDDSGEGDTVYVVGSNVNYGDISISKKVILKGDGLNSLNLKTELSSIVFKDQNARGTKISGFYIGSIKFEIDFIEKIEIFKNKIYSIEAPNNNPVLIYESIFYNNFIEGMYNLYLPNCIISNSIVWGMNGINQYPDNVVTLGSTLLSNNFLGGFWNDRFATYQNNFVLRFGYENSYQWSILKNNLYARIQDNNQDPFPFSNDQINEIDLFESIDDAIASSAWIGKANLHLKPNVKGVKGGTDGTDIGIYGGTYPWEDYPGTTDVTKIKSGISMMKEITVKNIAPSNGTLNVDIKATSTK